MSSFFKTKKCNCNRRSSNKNLVFHIREKKNTQKHLKMDQLFLLPARVLAMDSLSFREDVASVAPDFFSSHHLKNSPPHNSLDSTDSNRSSVRVLEDTEGLVFARASNGCLWLCKWFFSSFCLLHCILFVFIFILCVHKVWICILKNGTSTHQLLIKIHTRYI